MSTNFGYEYWRMHDRRLTLGGSRWSVPGEETGITDDRSINPAIGANLRQWLARRFPDIARHGVERQWTGIMAGTPDGLPLAGELPGRPGEYALLAFNGYGMSFAFLAGRCLVEMVVDGRSAVDGACLFRPDRFAGL
jgi:glycine/D-amino acid oxidase-like deaminating enzyme